MNRRPAKTVLALGVTTALVATAAAVGGSFAYAANRTPAPSPAARQAQEQPAEPGVLIASVEKDSPASRAGIVRGDILIRIGDTDVNTFREIQTVLQNRRPGEQVDVTVTHGDESRTRAVSLGDREGRAYLGIVPCDDLHAVKAIRLAGPGVFVGAVAENGPAAQAGVQRGDRIAAVNGEEVAAVGDLRERIAARQPGETMTLSLENLEGQRRDVSVTLGENPEQAGSAYLGIEPAPLPPLGGPNGFVMPFPGRGEGGRFFGQLPEGVESGAVVHQVVAGSPAEAAGLKEGDVITAVNGQSLEQSRSLSDAIAAYNPGDQVTLSVVGHGVPTPREVAVRLGENPDRAGSAYLGVRAGQYFRILRPAGEKPGNQDSTREMFREFSGPDRIFELPALPNLEPDEVPFDRGSV